MRAPRILIGATGSGSGKTTITCALLEILKRQGKKVQAFKCGPDYIDPMFHRTVLGIPSKNLDTFFTGEKMTAELFMESAVNVDVSVMEGVMGLYDGLGGIRKEGSAYDLATVTDTPVILIIDAHGMGRSILPLIAGFLSYDTNHLIRGIILNRTSGAFYETIRPEIEKSFPVEVLGYFPNQKDILLESRHLGLKRPEEIEQIAEMLTKTADMLEKTVDIGRLFAIADGALELPDRDILTTAEMTSELSDSDILTTTDRVSELPNSDIITTMDRASELPDDSTLEKDSSDNQKAHLQKNGKRPVIAVSRDEAFCFYYEDNLKALQKAGADIVFFSPLHDGSVPKEADGLLLLGGYPELYAKELSQNKTMLLDIREKAERGMPVVAECGGFMYLHQTMEDTEHHVYEMAGVVPGECFYTGKLVRFGYIELTEKEANFLPENVSIKGHEFHYFDSTANGDDCVALKPVSGKNYDCVFDKNSCFVGFPHLYYPSAPQFAENFVKKAKNYADRSEVNS